MHACMYVCKIPAGVTTVLLSVWYCALVSFSFRFHASANVGYVQFHCAYYFLEGSPPSVESKVKQIRLLRIRHCN